MEEALHDIAPLREHVGLGWDSRPPRERTVVRFRNLLEEYTYAQRVVIVVNDMLRDKGPILEASMAVDATPISAPRSTKDAHGARP
jgi:IS5 family transposase